MDHDTLTDRQFDTLGGLITSSLGIKMPDSKRVMLQGRLQRRVRQLGLPNLQAYYEQYFPEGRPQEGELDQLFDLATTNQTAFFREADHFEILRQRVLPEWSAQKTTAPFKLWCAGCATGEECYTLAFTLLEHQAVQPFEFSILGTDISRQALHKAVDAVYSEAHISPIPLPLRKKYLLRGQNELSNVVRIAPFVRSHVTFGRLNFLNSSYPLPDVYDAVFFRNVMIYFDRETQRQVLERICTRLRPGGWLFTSHSESLQGLDLPLSAVLPAAYQFKGQGALA